MPLHAPLQPVNVLPDAALATSVITVPAWRDAPHELPQLTHPVDETTVPEPVPALDTDTVKLLGVMDANLAETWRSWLSVTKQVACVPQDAPSSPQATKIDPVLAVAVSITDDGASKLAPQVPEPAAH